MNDRGRLQALIPARMVPATWPRPGARHGWRRIEGDAASAATVDVHLNNRVSALVGVLEDSFPVVRRLVGVPFFASMAAEHVAACPPRSPLLAEYGDGFPAWLEQHVPVAALPYLPDVARLEWLRQRAYHAADASADGSLVSALAAPDALPRLVARLHPSCALLRSPHGVVSLWSAHQQDDDNAIGRVRWMQAESALVVRDPSDQVLVLPMAEAHAAFVEALADGVPLGASASRLREGGDLPGLLALLIRHGVLVGWASTTSESTS